MEAPDIVTYDANCHCGAVKFTVDLEDMEQKYVIQCNCSTCTKHGLIVRHCKRGDIEFIRGDDKMKGYMCGPQTRIMRFCPVCATTIMFDAQGGAEEPDTVVAVNVGTIVDFDSEEAVIRRFNGRTVDPAYKVPA